MRNKLLIFLSFVLIHEYPVCSQEKSRILFLSGYLSTMESVMFDSLSGPLINDNLIHNRLNFKGDLTNHISFATELRNRLFVGDLVRSGISYSEMISNDPGWVDLSWNIIDEQSFFLNTTIDRLWLDFSLGKFQARAGRQRINWGQALVWNPNDIFNAYSFFDFDYIERPGSDAVRLQYYPGYSSVIEVAIKADNEDKISAAALVRFNEGGYDFQFLTGYVDSEDLVFGTGWSGTIGSVSFRGEASWFQPAGKFSDSSGTGLVTAGFDRSFRNNSIAQMQFMYCNNPIDISGFILAYSGNISTKEMAFSKFTAFGQFSYPITPLFTAGVSAMWFPDLKGYFSGSSIDYSVAENVDLSFLWQRFDYKINNNRAKLNIVFLRVKFSF